MAQSNDTPVRLAVLGAGLIGRRHVDHVLNEDCAELMAIVDPSDVGKALAAEKGTGWYPDFATMIRRERPDGVIISTPNQMHVANGLEAVAAGVPALVEKPLADNVAAATTLVEAAEKAGVALMTGHHRRHNPMIRQAKAVIASGRLGQLVSVHGSCWFYKPDDYFDLPWRREKGAGPVFLNLIHDVDLLRYLCGEVAEVQAMESNALRGNAVEETAVVLLRFASGVLGTVNVSDKIVAPWSWEFTAGENPAYTHTQETCYMIGGTLGSLTVPYLDLWHNPTKPSWWEPIVRERLPVEYRDPLGLQVRNLCEVVRGTAKPVVSGREGLETLKVIEAVKQAAATGRPVRTN
ncbi:putative dehydrogenase [Azospirillum lipoferum]|uniref:Gfo/Idh/MocA family oxidoreductase n=1 Tax=Azospirillum lipoferum TaxID=193 RepID=A0A5A9GMA5_AZOLI|nr:MULTISPECIES: Gfo/Idh/MocA family oxidoreductase [Azospirillum]KAA0594922.1 Gfo/Idh/MocA family oxidoreductase [Azospirillum lipoferum]MCP1612746.1 putative dehydrogenase [Azospirillum lipoferum]MDW5532117.1 Gfo/Idh/MocA family oxidoreductase [Azospirillum sp. NL1]